MGMYTELIFQGRTKECLPENIKKLIDYFFDEEGVSLDENIELPDHPFFKGDRWDLIGYCSSFYFNPFSLRYSQDYIVETGSKNLFLRCDIKNYDSDIQKFLDWIKPYMEHYWGYYWYEEWAFPTIFKHNRYDDEY